jgi:hypothetical protein
MSTARRPKSWPWCALVLAAAAVGCAKGNEATGAAGSGGSTGAAGSGGGGFNPYASYAAKALHVQGNRILDTTGATVRLLGVNRAGSEYMCVPPTSGSYVFDGATGPSTIAGMKAWHINTVRLPLTDACWLGINGTLVSAEQYREEITNYMLQLHANGIYVVLDLHWSAPGTMGITGSNQLVTMAFADHALDFWTSVATTFKDDPMVVFDLFNEPILNANDRMGHTPVSDPWGCWLNGCNLTSGTRAQVAGMQSMLDAVRAAGARQLVVAGGIEWAHNMDGWLAHKPVDPAGNLLAGFHVYQPNLSDCVDLNCWNGSLAQVAAQVPVLVGEMGEQDCAHGFIDGFMAWADGKGMSYLGWAWNPQNCGTFPALVTDFNGTPTNFGIGLRDHLIQINP